LSEGPQQLESKYLNSFLVFRGIYERTSLRLTFPDYKFYFKNKEEKQAFVLLSKAFENNEILLPPGKFVKKISKRDQRKIKENQTSK
jgi:hypothetical protein